MIGRLAIVRRLQKSYGDSGGFSVVVGAGAARRPFILATAGVQSFGVGIWGFGVWVDYFCFVCFCFRPGFRRELDCLLIGGFREGVW